jgi:hypothetical protein
MLEMLLVFLDGCSTFASAYVGRKRRCAPDFLYSALDKTAFAAFVKESRMRCATATSCTGNPGLAPSTALRR